MTDNQKIIKALNRISNQLASLVEELKSSDVDSRGIVTKNERESAREQLGPSLSVTEASKVLNVTRGTVYYHINKGDIVRVHGLSLVDTESVLDLIYGKDE